MNQARKDAIKKGAKSFRAETLLRYEWRYEEILGEGRKA